MCYKHCMNTDHTNISQTCFTNVQTNWKKRKIVQIKIIWIENFFLHSTQTFALAELLKTNTDISVTFTLGIGSTQYFFLFFSVSHHTPHAVFILLYSCGGLYNLLRWFSACVYACVCIIAVLQNYCSPASAAHNKLILNWRVCKW